MATVTRTLKLPFLRLNRVKAEELARLQARHTEVAHAILAMPKAERRKLTTRSFARIEIGSAWINQATRKTMARTRVRCFRCLSLETSNQNWTRHKVGETWSVSFGLLRGSQKRVPIEVHTASHRECLEALLDGRAKAGSLKEVSNSFNPGRVSGRLVSPCRWKFPARDSRAAGLGLTGGRTFRPWQPQPMVPSSSTSPVGFAISGASMLSGGRNCKGKHRALRKLGRKAWPEGAPYGHRDPSRGQ